ncbi:hypothetical protein [Aeromicrobium fastidiosum]|uniref:AbiEi antitoxin C-terminal domain-containing protein n=2 Tax=Aeromicrobium fastidiosum TaxID=52699 RepID=A0A641APD2_9ACTN|nr:hypothetical protein [Aeromicrobium fastidiosum]KAA1376499.1 hypothetical protein ESP62_013835 [Aeromicrobium fastidiosum]MBP2391583.1 hypothetical protein [Aeromicrobium fastidiosum]
MRTGTAVADHGRSAVRHAIAAGRWQRPARGVVVDHNGPLSRDELDVVRLHACAPRSALAGLSALRLDGFTGFAPPHTDVVQPEGSKRPSSGLAGLVPHWSTELGDLDVHPLLVPRRTRSARSVVDAAAWATSDRQAVAIVLAAFQQGLVAARTVHDALARRGPMRRRALVRESVLDAGGGVQSLPERDFDDIRRGAGLPAPSRQRAVRSPTGRYYLDAGWDAWDVAVEIHGLPHLEVQQWSADVVRANEVVIGGPRLIAFTSYATRHQKALVADQLTRLLRSAGWD